MQSTVISDTLRFRQVICALKKAGFEEAPTFDETVDALREATDSSLRKWALEQNTEQFEQLLFFHWREP